MQVWMRRLKKKNEIRLATPDEAPVEDSKLIKIHMLVKLSTRRQKTASRCLT